MARRRKSGIFPNFPKFKSGTLTRRGIMRNEDREPVRRKKPEEFVIKWEPEARRDHERLLREHNYNENRVWDALREKFGLKVFTLFLELSQQKFTNIAAIKRALVVIEIRHLSRKMPGVDMGAITHQAIKNIRSLRL